MKTTRSKVIALLAVLLIVGAAAFAWAGTGVTLVPRTASAAPALYSQDAVTAIYDNASPAVVEINVVEGGTGFFGRSIQSGQGSGFLIDTSGHILTNNHVVDGATSVQVVFKDGKTVDARIIGTDANDDLAVIQVDASVVSGVTPLQFADSNAVKPGEMAIALGSPYGLTGSITVGVISGISRSLSGSQLTGLLQTDAAINPGNSGGPLLNSSGQVVGINAAVEAASGAHGIGFAVASNTAKKVLPDLLLGKTVQRPWLGISGGAVTSALKTDLKLTVDQGVYVVTVVAGSPAEQAGLKAGGTDSNGNPTAGGDVITAVDGHAVASVTDLSTYFSTKSVGDMVTLTVVRNGASLSVPITLAAWPQASQSGGGGALPTPHPSLPRGWGN